MEIDIIKFQQYNDKRGSLVVAETDKEIPFDVKRIYYIYGVNDKESRGFHSHRKLEQIYIAIHGSCTVKLDDGIKYEVKKLDNPAEGLYIGHGVWREIYDFSDDAVLLVLASEKYSEDDYIRNYEDFLESLKENR